MKILVNHNSAIPLYLQIEEQLRTIIKGEEYNKVKCFQMKLICLNNWAYLVIP